MRDLINRIPGDERTKILEQNMIAKAQPSADNYFMKYLMIIWKAYLEPDLVVTCTLCYVRILNNFKAMQDLMVKMEREQNLLND